MSKLTVVFALIVGLAACGKDAKNNDKDKGGGDKPAVMVSPDMMGFTESLHGKSADVAAALKKSGADGLDKKDMDMYDLASPHVTATEKRGDKQCYTMDAKAGATTRTYDVCWTGSKITEIDDKGMH
jgi:hypothetical protein